MVLNTEVMMVTCEPQVGILSPCSAGSFQEFVFSLWPSSSSLLYPLPEAAAHLTDLEGQCRGTPDNTPKPPDALLGWDSLKGREGGCVSFGLRTSALPPPSLTPTSRCHVSGCKSYGTSYPPAWH